MSNQATPARSATATRRGSRPDRVYRVLRRAIVELALRPGAKLPEDGIGERLGVSRTVVRRALERLRAEELVEIEPNRGAAVACPSLAEAQDVFSVRIDLERIVVERLCGRLDAKHLERIEHCIAREESAYLAGSQDYVRHAAEFHLLLAELCSSPLLARYMRSLLARSALILGLYGRPSWPNCSMQEHRAITDAICAGDVARAQACMREHLDSVLHRAIETAETKHETSVLDVIAGYARSLGA